MSSITGQCLCGAIHYAMGAPAHRVTLCTCHFCQRATGADRMTLPVFDLSALTVSARTPATYSHVSEGSGKEIHIHHCPRCATKLWLTFARWPALVGLYCGTLDDPDQVTLDPERTKQIFLSSARRGTVVLPGIPAYWNHATKLEGTPERAYRVNVPTLIQDMVFDEA